MSSLPAKKRALKNYSISSFASENEKPGPDTKILVVGDGDFFVLTQHGYTATEAAEVQAEEAPGCRVCDVSR